MNISKNIYSKKIFAIVTTQFEGLHFFEEASGDESFLKYPHRHLFHLKVVIEQFHDNREIEFINFKRWLDVQLKNKSITNRSCEMIAKEIGLVVLEKYGNRELLVSVMEDGENGGLITFSFKDESKLPNIL